MTTLFHGTSADITVFNRQSQFTTSWIVAASFACERADETGGEAWVYTVSGDVAKVVETGPCGKVYEMDTHFVVELGEKVYTCNTSIPVISRFRVARKLGGGFEKV